MTEFKRKGKDYLNMERFLTRAEALSRLRELWRFEPGRERVALAQANGRVCAESAASRWTLPIARVAGPDGIAVRFADFEQGMPDTGGWKEGVDYVAADCGDDVADAFDTVINIERVSFSPEGGISLALEGPLQRGQMVRERGAMLREGENVIQPGTAIRPYHLGLLAGAGLEDIAVLARPKVAFIPTGNELVPHGETPARGQNVNSNSLMAAAFLAEWQAAMIAVPIVRDQKAELEKSLDAALEASDIVILNGGSSMGSEDFVSGLLSRRGSFCQHGVRCIPGMPMAVAIIDGKPVINMPGPPFAAFCAFDWCVHPLISHWYGQPAPRRKTISAVLEKEITKPERMEFYARLHLFEHEDGVVHADPIRMDDRYAEATCRFNGLHIMPIGCATYESGHIIEAEILHSES